MYFNYSRYMYANYYDYLNTDYDKQFTLIGEKWRGTNNEI